MTAPPSSLDTLLDTLIRDVPDYPKPGVVFKDITPLLADHAGFTTVVSAMAAVAGDLDAPVDAVVGIEARGFILAAPVALALGVGFVPVRKAGKLPGPTYEVSYSLEYGEATLQVHRDALVPGDRVLIVDDVLATGGTVAATRDLVGRCGAEVAGVVVLLELAFLSGRGPLGDLFLSALRVVD
ncbi:MAG: adenine phosphoribosyltransferase [Nocardioidaceae bacterium]|jgi:adenine phosphoribosyltransferase|nr:adenine phosphoribosyltransferase [Nocardioidaceae bacterium]